MGKPIIEWDIDQLSDEWHMMHGCVPSASRFDEIVTTRGEPSKSRYGYMSELAASIAWGVKRDTFQSYDMRRGVELEPFAREQYEITTMEIVEQCGFVWYDERKDRGCSPDGIIGKTIPWETKAPRLKRHTQYFLDDDIKDAYFQQRQGQIYIMRSEYVVFCDYYPGAPLFIRKVYRDDKFIEKLDLALDEFVDELNDYVDKLKNR